MVEVHWTLKVHCWPRHEFNFIEMFKIHFFGIYILTHEWCLIFIQKNIHITWCTYLKRNL